MKTVTVLLVAALACVSADVLKRSAPDPEIDNFRQGVLDQHNVLREKHGAPPMTLNQELNEFSQAWADHLANTGTFQHSNCQLGDGRRVGENLYASSWPSDGSVVSNQWYSEISDYDFANPGFYPMTGHFTQLVWADSVELGVGRATASNGWIFTVANYYPPGNYLNQFEDNVLPLETP